MTALHIYLPRRIGDCMMCLPALVALKCLYQAHQSAHETVVLHAIEPLYALVDAFGLFETRVFTWRTKWASWLSPPDETMFLCTSNQHTGLRTGRSYGLINKSKPLYQLFHNYDVHMPYLSVGKWDACLPEELVGWMKESYGFSAQVTGFMGVCLSLGFTVEQVKEAFHFDASALDLSHRFQPKAPSEQGYVVMSMEAAYGSTRGAVRRWDPQNFLDVARHLHTEYGLHTKVMGLEATPALPNEPYLHDVRQQLSIWQAAEVMAGAVACIGNDSGLVHLANVLQVPTLAVYLATSPKHYGPIYPQWHQAIEDPASVDGVKEALSSIVKTSSVVSV